MRRATLSLLAALALPGLVLAQDAKASVTVNVVGARNASGKLLVDLYRDGTGFPGEPSNAFRREALAIDPKNLTAQVAWSDLTPGLYAIAVLHDENGNGKMDKNFIGIPKEGHGASNNPMVKRPPKFEEAQVAVKAGPQTIEIKLFY